MGRKSPYGELEPRFQVPRSIFLAGWVTLCDKFVNLEGKREKRRGAWEQIQAPLLLIYQEFVYLRDHLLLESILDASIIKLFIRQPSIRKNPYRQQFSTMECGGLPATRRYSILLIVMSMRYGKMACGLVD